jgi:ribonucleoside-diphosphate reductase beta chain
MVSDAPPVRDGGTQSGTFCQRLLRIARLQGPWDPQSVDLSEDEDQWSSLCSNERDQFLHLGALFLSGEEAVARDLSPLIELVTAEQRLDEADYLHAFLLEETTHVAFFEGFMTQVCRVPRNVPDFPSNAYRCVMQEELPAALQRLRSDSSPEAQVRAVATYHMTVEGIMAETGYFLLSRVLSTKRLLPGTQLALARLRRDESRHIAFGSYFVGRLVAEHGNTVYGAFLQRMIELKPLVEESTRQLIASLGTEEATGIGLSDVFAYSARRFAPRIRYIQRARAIHPATFSANGHRI